jgi:hypothetical protein
VITDTDAASPLLRAVKLEHVTVSKAAAMALPKDAGGWRLTEPLRFADQPLLIAGTRPQEKGEQRLAALGFRVTDSDLPLRVAFPLMISNTLQWLAGASVVESPNLRAGELLPLDTGTTATLPPERPGGATLSGPAQEERGEIRPLQNGFYRLRAGGNERWVAVNTAAEAESDLRAGASTGSSSTSATSALGTALLKRVTFSGWPAWQILAFAALALFAMEWWLFHRRRTE